MEYEYIRICKVDSNGRIAIPICFKEWQSGTSVVIQCNYNLGYCCILQITDVDYYFDQVEAEIGGEVEKARVFFGTTCASEIDARRRLKIPETLFKNLFSSDEVLLINFRGSRLEVWEPESWRRYCRRKQAD